MIGDPMPAGKRLYGMAPELGRAVARGLMPLEHAYAACIASAVEAERTGQLGRYKVPNVVKGMRHLVGLWEEKERIRRQRTEWRIVRLIKPMIAVRKEWGALMAEAHGANGADDFPLTEQEVTDLVRMEVWHDLPAPSPGPSHVR